MCYFCIVFLCNKLLESFHIYFAAYEKKPEKNQLRVRKEKDEGVNHLENSSSSL